MNRLNASQYIKDKTPVTHQKGQWTATSRTYPIDEFELNNGHHQCTVIQIASNSHLIAVTERNGTTHVSLDFDVEVRYEGTRSQIVPASTVKELVISKIKQKRKKSAK